MISENDVSTVLKDDGVSTIDIENFQNLNQIKIQDLDTKYGKNISWAVRVTYNKDFGGVLIKQLPGEGNRVHKHPNACECWFIVSGQWKWYIEGIGEMSAEKGSIINVKPNTFHQITCVGDQPGIRFAVTVPDVEHVYK